MGYINSGLAKSECLKPYSDGDYEEAFGGGLDLDKHEDYVIFCGLDDLDDDA